MLHQYYPQPKEHGFKWELNKDMTFDSAHYIPDEQAGKCSNIHGHTYSCNLTIAGNKLDGMGFLVNFSDLKKLIHGHLDHQLINSLHLDGFMPSTEKMAEEIFKRVEDYLEGLPNSPFCLQVILRETPTSYVIYRP
jgi:6-pyruvoyltetrahydropterin/6-carboxytetrahydropterin synthase